MGYYEVYWFCSWVGGWGLGLFRCGIFVCIIIVLCIILDFGNVGDMEFLYIGIIYVSNFRYFKGKIVVVKLLLCNVCVWWLLGKIYVLNFLKIYLNLFFVFVWCRFWSCVLVWILIIIFWLISLNNEFVFIVFLWCIV